MTSKKVIVLSLLGLMCAGSLYSMEGRRYPKKKRVAKKKVARKKQAEHYSETKGYAMSAPMNVEARIDELQKEMQVIQRILIPPHAMDTNPYTALQEKRLKAYLEVEGMLHQGITKDNMQKVRKLLIQLERKLGIIEAVNKYMK